MSPVISIVHVDFASPENDLRSTELERYQELPQCAKEDFLVGRAAVKQALKNYVLVNPDKGTEDICVNNFDSGQPYFENYAAICCSISHSRGYGMGGVAPYRIGVDIERIRPRKKLLLHYIAEQQELVRVKDFFGTDTDETTLIWTIKESVMKGLGVGMNIPPKQIVIGKKTAKGAFKIHVKGEEQSCWQAWPFRLDNIYLCVAYEKKHRREPHIHWISRDVVSPAKA